MGLSLSVFLISVSPSAATMLTLAALSAFFFRLHTCTCRNATPTCSCSVGNLLLEPTGVHSLNICRAASSVLGTCHPQAYAYLPSQPSGPCSACCLWYGGTWIQYICCRLEGTLSQWSYLLYHWYQWYLLHHILPSGNIGTFCYGNLGFRHLTWWSWSMPWTLSGTWYLIDGLPVLWCTNWCHSLRET